MHKIEVSGLTVQYREGNGVFTALEAISFAVEQGEFVSIIGSSGCGKSTLLGILGGLRRPDAGAASIDGKQVTGPGPDRSMVFQHYSLFPWMTARNNVAFGIKQVKKNLPRRERLDKAAVFLAKVGLEHVSGKYPGQLSGGMRQRVAIARALAMDTEILLMDEPFGAVDARNRTILQELLLRLWEGGADDVVYPPGEGPRLQDRKTVVFVTHDIDEAILLADRIIMMRNSPGKIYREIAVPFERPRNRASLIQTPEYTKLRNELLALFFNDFGSAI
ncbi:MAG: ABC transporter ATP-binding protein [Treponema sp.]|nr:ABC transporter ATP-binding protein [Treponema sp.]